MRPAVKTSTLDTGYAIAPTHAPTHAAAYTMSKHRKKPRTQCRVGFNGRKDRRRAECGEQGTPLDEIGERGEPDHADDRQNEHRHEPPHTVTRLHR